MSSIPYRQPTSNLFSDSPLNRLSWLRPSQSFLNAIIELPSVRWILFNNGKPLLVVVSDGASDLSSSSSTFTLAYLNTSDVRPLLGQKPYFGQGKEPGEFIPDARLAGYANQNSTTSTPSPTTESLRHRGLRIVFLGLHKTGGGGREIDTAIMALPSSDFTDPEELVQKLEGTPYFSLDLAYTPEEWHRFLVTTTWHARQGKDLIWSDPRSIIPLLHGFDAAIYASASIMVDWNVRNKFCPGCGSPSYSMWGGWKIICSSLLPWSVEDTKPCITSKGLHNFMHPRTDVVVIMIAIDQSGDKILLGRGRKHPGKYYSAVAGFIEPGESLEDAVAREMLEEAGVHVWNVKYHSGQPWPYPANLMVGFYARADSTKSIRIDLDKELIDCRWFTRQEIKSVLENTKASSFRMENYEHIDNSEEPSFMIPPSTSIAGVLIRDWLDGNIGFPSGDQNLIQPVR